LAIVQVAPFHQRLHLRKPKYFSNHPPTPRSSSDLPPVAHWSPEPVPGWDATTALSSLNIERVPFAMLDGNVVFKRLSPGFEYVVSVQSGGGHE